MTPAHHNQWNIELPEAAPLVLGVFSGLLAVAALLLAETIARSFIARAGLHAAPFVVWCVAFVRYGEGRGR